MYNFFIEFSMILINWCARVPEEYVHMIRSKKNFVKPLTLEAPVDKIKWSQEELGDNMHACMDEKSFKIAVKIFIRNLQYKYVLKNQTISISFQ